MGNSKKKWERLTRVARLYYLEDKTQSEIAQMLGVSRPMISRMLKEARDEGIVRIEVMDPLSRRPGLSQQLREQFSLTGCVTVGQEANSKLTNRAVARAAIQLLDSNGAQKLGLGWGSIIGEVVSELEPEKPDRRIAAEVVPLVGSLGGSNRNYHTNELVRVLAQQTLSKPHSLHAPAFSHPRQELSSYRAFESFAGIQRLWDEMDTALIGIANHPSTPDFATRARFGGLLDSKKAVGRLLSYYFGAGGEIIHSDTDYALQVPLESLVRCPRVIAVCSCNVSAGALLGALRTGVVDCLIAPESLAKAVLQAAETDF